MMDSKRTAETVARIADVAARELLTAQRRISDAFAACEIVSAGTMENLIAAQSAANLTAGLETRWNRGGMAAIESWLEEAAEVLIECTPGGSTSLVQNQIEVADRKAMQAAYKALSRCRA